MNNFTIVTMVDNDNWYIETLDTTHRITPYNTQNETIQIQIRIKKMVEIVFSSYLFRKIKFDCFLFR